MTASSPTAAIDAGAQHSRAPYEQLQQTSLAERRSARITEVVYAIFVLAAGVLLVASAV
ncbi:hypothetical protein [Granulicella arctica]|uniref:hypothetical protein n=1 Tax=Granulicella arctica TaxID=940613 RepID=UPI0021DF7769|nr:hypothetical protein [Granulicella arctica]